VEQGLSAQESEDLVKQMVLGASRLMLQSDQPLTTLRQAVTTKGGTTEAGLRALQDGGFAQLIAQCVERATARSRELSGG
jgi:pyrroline-5-carboxylate reductase